MSLYWRCSAVSLTGGVTLLAVFSSEPYWRCHFTGGVQRRALLAVSLYWRCSAVSLTGGVTLLAVFSSEPYWRCNFTGGVQR